MCEYCEKGKPLSNEDIRSIIDSSGDLVMTSFSDGERDYVTLNFCPMCSEKLRDRMNKTLLQILVDELPKRGGWPKRLGLCVQLSCGTVSFTNKGQAIQFNNRVGDWNSDSWVDSANGDYDFKLGVLAANWSMEDSVVTREQYEAALKECKND